MTERVARLAEWLAAARPTPLDGCADLVIRGKAGDVLPAALAEVRAWATR